MGYLELRNVCAFHGSTKVVSDVSLAVQQGERFGLLGPSGSGKTTLLRLVAGLHKARAGTIVLDSEIVSSSEAHIAPERRQVGMVFQSLGLWSHLNVHQHLDLVLKEVTASSAVRKTEAERLLEMARLTGLEHRRPAELSGGEQQRLALARALAQKPKMLLLDEPFAHVDEPLRDELCDGLVNILETSNASALIVSHDGPHLAALCDRLALITAGGLLQQGDYASLYRSPVCREAARLTGPCFFVGAHSDGSMAQGTLGMVPLHETVAKGDGWLCLRPEDFHLRNARSETLSPVARVISSRFVSGRWKIRFLVQEEEFWTWEASERACGEELALDIGPAAFIPYYTPKDVEEHERQDARAGDRQSA